MAAASPKKAVVAPAAALKSAQLREVFDKYCGFGQGKDKKIDGMESRTFYKLFNEAGLVHPKGLSRTDIDLIFTKFKPKGGANKLDFELFCGTLAEVAQKRFPKTFKEKGADAALEQVLEKLTSIQGPGLAEGVVVPGEVRFFDDKESYTGVHKLGGPDMADTSGVKLEKLLDRSPADARGRHMQHK